MSFYRNSKAPGVPVYDNASLFPPVSYQGALAEAADTNTLYSFDMGTWVVIAAPTGFSGVTSLNALTGALTLVGGAGISVTPSGSSITIANTAGGTVTSVALADSSSIPIYGITGSPVTSSGTLTLTLSSQTANKAFLGPVSGGPAQPTFRALVPDDLALSGTSGQVLTTNGSGVLSWASSVVYALRDLSNLTSPTAINQDLLPGADLSISLGNGSKRYLTGSIATISTSSINAIGNGDLTISTSGAGSNLILSPNNTVDFSNKPSRDMSRLGLLGNGFDVNIQPSASTSSGYTLTLPTAQGGSGQTLSNNGAGILSWVTPTSGTVTSVALTVPSFLSVSGSPITSSGTLAVTLANESAHAVFIGPASGSPAAPTFRALVPDDLALSGTAGQQLTTNGAGVLSWTSDSVYALRDLSNLTNPTAVNQILNDSSAIASLDLTVRSMYDSSAIQSVDYEFRSLLDSAGNQSVDYENRLLYDSAVNQSADYENRILYDSSGLQAANWDNRLLNAVNGSTNLNWNVAGILSTGLGTEFRLDGATSGYVGIKSPAAPSSYTLTFPNAQGASGQTLRNNGAGILTWVTPTAGTVTSVATGTGLTGGPITSTGTISLANTTVTPGSYTNTNLTVDAQGRITTASSGPASPSGDPDTVAFFDGSGTLSDQTDFTWDGTTLTVPGDINPDLNDTRNIGNATTEYASIWAATHYGITAVNVTALAGDATVSGNGVQLLANTTNVILSSTSGNVDLNAAAGTITLATTTGPVTVQGDSIILSDSAAINQIAIAGTTLTPTAGLMVVDGKVELTDRLQLDGATSGAINVLAPAVTTSYNLQLPANAGTSGYALTTNGSGVTSWTAVASPNPFVKYTKSFSDFSTAATTNTIALFSLPAATIIEQVIVKQTASFTGGTISAYTVSVGISSSHAKYASAFDVFQAPGSAVAEISTSPNFEDFSSPVTITVTAISTGDTLNNASTGSVDIYVLTKSIL